MTGPPPSGIRKFYEKIENVGERNEKYLCGLCSTVVSSSVAATSNLIKHMRKHHPKEFENYLKEQGKTDSHQQRPGGSGSSSNSNAEKRVRFIEESHYMNSRRLVRFLAGTLLSPSILDKLSFTQFVHGLDPRFQIPSSHHLNMVILPQTYENIREKLKQNLSQAKGVCITVDVLKDHYENYVLIILGSYITLDWRKCSSLLTCRLFKTLPMKSYILNTYETVINEMNLADKVQCITIGTLRNKKKAKISFIGWDSTSVFHMKEDDAFVSFEAFDAMFEEFSHAQKCFSDALQDVVAKGIAELSVFHDQVMKISSMVYSLNTFLGGDETGKMINPITDWIEQVKFMKSCLKNPAEDHQSTSAPNIYDEHSSFLHPSDRSVLSEIVEVFEAFEDASERIQSATGTASSQVLPIIRGLRHHLQTLNLSHLNAIANSFSMALDEHMTEFESSEVLRQASLVDPRFKAAWCNPEEQSLFQSMLQMNAIKVSVQESNTSNVWSPSSSDTPKRPKLFSYMASDRPTPKPWTLTDINECAREEVSRFLSTPCREHDVNPLDFWRGMETEFPLIAGVARRCLCVDVATISTKDIFGEDFSLSQGIHLHDDEFEKLVFLKANIENI